MAGARIHTPATSCFCRRPDAVYECHALPLVPLSLSPLSPCPSPPLALSPSPAERSRRRQQAQPQPPPSIRCPVMPGSSAIIDYIK